MALKKKESLRRSIKMGSAETEEGRIDHGTAKADEGQITFVAGLFLTLFLAVLLTSYLQMEMVSSSARYVEDALAASGLACALVDLREYGTSHVLRIEDEERSFAQYQVSLRTNLGLDENWECANKRLISGRVLLESFVIYNVAGGQVECCQMTGDRIERTTGRLGEVCAPNGQKVEHTGVYGEISYELKGIWGMTVPARRGKLVDIVGEET